MIEVDDPARAIAVLSEYGAACFHKTFAPSLITRLASEFGHYVANDLLHSGGHYYQVGDRRLMIPVPLRSPFTDDELLDSSALRPIFEALLGPDYVIQSYGAVLSMPGAAPQHIHRDYSLLYNPAIGANLPPHAFTVVIPLVQVTEQTGTTGLLLGTHTMGDGEVYLPFPELGGCYLWDYRLHHFGMPNRSKIQRPILYLVYARPWFVDPKNFHTVPPLRKPEAKLSSRMAALLRRSYRPRVEGA